MKFMENKINMKLKIRIKACTITIVNAINSLKSSSSSSNSMEECFMISALNIWLISKSKKKYKISKSKNAKSVSIRIQINFTQSCTNNSIG